MKNQSLLLSPLIGLVSGTWPVLPDCAGLESARAGGVGEFSWTVIPHCVMDGPLRTRQKHRPGLIVGFFEGALQTPKFEPHRGMW